MLFTVKRCFTYLDGATGMLLFKALVRPILEYAIPAWSPRLIRDIESLEKIQRRATRMMPGLRQFDYSDRLRQLDLPTLVFRRKRGDMIELYKYVHGCYRYERPPCQLTVDRRTRGHNLKIFVTRSRTNVRASFFSSRAVHDWNSLTS